MTTYADILDEWMELQEIKDSVKPTSASKWRREVAYIKAYPIARLDIVDITNDTILDHIRYISTPHLKPHKKRRPRKKEAYGKSVVSSMRRILIDSHRLASERGYCAPLTYRIPMVRTYDTEVDVERSKHLTPPQAKVLMDTLTDIVAEPCRMPWCTCDDPSAAGTDRNRRYAMGAMVGLSCGLRIGEVCGLKVGEHIDAVTRRVEVTRPIKTYRAKDGTYVIEHGTAKSESSVRTVPIPPSIAALFATYLPPSGYLVPTGAKGLPVPANLSAWFKRLMDHLHVVKGLPRITFHGMRHSYATRLMQSSVDDKTLSELLGHRDVRITQSIYLHPDDDSKARAVDAADW